MLSILGQFPRPFSSDLFRKFTNLEEFFRCPESQGWREVLGGGGGGVGGGRRGCTAKETVSRFYVS